MSHLPQCCEDGTCHLWECNHCGDAGHCDCEEKKTHTVTYCDACEHFLDKARDA